MRNKKMSVKFITTVAILSAIGTILFFIGGVPIIPFAPHLKVDLSTIPSLIASITIGPLGAFWVEVIKSVLHLMKTDTFGIGELASFVVGVAITVPYGFFFRKYIGKFNYAKASVIAIGVSFLTAEISGILINMAVYPIYMNLLGVGVESATVYFTYIGSVIIMNLVKFIITILVAFPLCYKLYNAKLFDRKI